MTDKPCKLCEKKRFANTSFCYAHYRAREAEKKKLKAVRKLERKVNTKGFQEELRKKLLKQAWKLMSEWVRRKDANEDGYVECYTCGAFKHYKEMDCGHFKHDRLDLDERNLKTQCARCNRHLSGRLDVYAEKLIQDNGLEWFDQLVRDAHAYQKYTIPEIVAIIRDLKVKLENIA